MKSCYFPITREDQTYKLHYLEWGAADNSDVVVCVHGLTRNCRDFDKLAQALADDYRVICPDVVGRGASERLQNPANYHYGTYTQDLMTLIRTLTSKECRLNWVGTSMGGLIGMFLAANAADKSTPYLALSSLVLNDVGYYIGRTALERIAAYVGKQASFKSVADWQQHLRKYSSGFGPLSDEHWQYIAKHSCKKHAEDDYRPAYDPNIAQVFGAVTQDVDLKPLWEKVKCPVLLIRGGRSDILSSETAYQMRQNPNVQFEEFEHVGHAPMLMESEQIEVVRRYLLDNKR